MKIFKFSPENLALSLSNHYTSPEVISKKNHFLFLDNYLGASGLDTKTILIEEEYISKDYLHDYATYYALCFEKYPKFCKRIHFFNIEFESNELKYAVLDKENNDFFSSYLGFIVVKPIPFTNIGYTVLKTFAAGIDFDKRNFWGTREYNVHLLGKEIKLQSLAFQEQDTVLSACATTAIWSMLNKASLDYHTKLKSPNEITRDADKTSLDGSRLFPNKGLNVLQICQAIENSGLVSEVKQPNFTINFPELKLNNFSVLKNNYTKKILNAYSSIGIPIILVVSVPNGENYGLHALTVSGFKQCPPLPIKPREEVSWLSENIEKFYAHDDQWGPFARIEFEGDYRLKTPWSDYHKAHNPTFITNIIVPLYPKIRISYEEIEFLVLGIDAILTLFFKDKIKSDLVWDIKIEFSNNIKNSLRLSDLEDNVKMRILGQSLPRYLWVASCYIDKIKVFDFTFDATDIKSGMIGSDIICHLPEVKPILAKFLQKNRALLEELFRHNSKKNYYEFLIDHLRK